MPAKTTEPKPIVKFKFDKIDQEIPVYLDTDMKFKCLIEGTVYDAPSAEALRNKIKKMVETGATKKLEWQQVLCVTFAGQRYSYRKDNEDEESFQVDVDRFLVAKTSGGKLLRCNWNEPELTRLKASSELYRVNKQADFKLPHIEKSTYSDEVKLYLAYDLNLEQIYRDTLNIVRRFRLQMASLQQRPELLVDFNAAMGYLLPRFEPEKKPEPAKKTPKPAKKAKIEPAGQQTLPEVTQAAAASQAA